MPKTTLTVLAWLFTCIQVFGDPQDKVKSLKDNVSEESAQRLYSYNPLGTYASANPHGAFSFQVPAVVSSNVAASHLVPVKTENIIVRNSNGFLKDSYGNKFVETPQSVAYKSILPQQYVQLQDLPAHLSQPLLASAPTYQYRIPSGQYAYGAPYNSFQVQSSPAALTTKYTGQQRPFVYAENIRSSAPTPAVLSQIRGRATPFHQSLNTESAPAKALRQQSNNKLIFVNPHHYAQGSNINQEPKFQRLEHSSLKNPHAARSNNLVASENNTPQNSLPSIQSITTYVNGKKTVINLEARPLLPLLDISLLEPLTFSNPVVPQMQHYLPKIPMATYKKLPDFKVDEAHKHADEFVITKTKSYDSGIIKDGGSNDAPEAQEQNIETSREQSSSENEDQEEDEPNQSHEHPDVPEKDSPNYRETYNEQIVSYNKETQNDPKTYSYSKQTQNQPVEYTYSKQVKQKPVHYTYIHDSNVPLLVKEINYEEEAHKPKELINKFNVNDKRNTGGITKSHESAVSYKDQRDHEPYQPPQHQKHNTPQPQVNHKTTYETLSPPQTQANQRNLQPQHQPHYITHHEHIYQSEPQQHPQYQPQHQSQHPPNYQPQHQSQHQLQHQPQIQLQHEPQHQLSHQPQPQTHHRPQYQPQHQPQYQPQHQTHSLVHRKLQNEPQRQPQQNVYQQPHKEYQTNPDEISNDSSHLRPEHKSEPHHHHNQHVISDPPKVYYQSHPIQVITNPTKKQVPHNVQTIIPKEYEENIHLVAPQKPQSSYHRNLPKPAVKNNYNPIEEVQHKPGNRHSHHSKHVIIQDKSPDEKHLHDEKMMKEEVGHEENSEEDFEKAYKNAAYGFPAFNKDSDEDEKVFDPESYGVPKYNAEFSIENNPFQQYQQENDEYPKNMRASYKDATDKTKENYYQDYSINKPESLLDPYQNKLEYYKMFRKQKPEYYVGDKKEKSEVAKYTVAPSFIFNSQPKKSKQFGHYQSSPDSYEYDYSREAPSDSTAYGTRAFQKTKSNTQFVEPQYQYGFEPLALPQLLDSELAAMASNDNLDSEKPLRKKIYKENFYIKKTSTSAGKPVS